MKTLQDNREFQLAVSKLDFPGAIAVAARAALRVEPLTFTLPIEQRAEIAKALAACVAYAGGTGLREKDRPDLAALEAIEREHRTGVSALALSAVREAWIATRAAERLDGFASTAEKYRAANVPYPSSAMNSATAATNVEMISYVGAAVHSSVTAATAGAATRGPSFSASAGEEAWSSAVADVRALNEAGFTHGGRRRFVDISPRGPLGALWTSRVPHFDLHAIELVRYYSCFISYSSPDEAFAQQLHARLEREGISCWFAPEDMKGGARIHDQIDEAIRLYDKLLLILSRDSIRSDWVITELRKARKAGEREHKRKIFPIRLVGMDVIRAWECFDADSGKDLAAEVREYFIPDFTQWRYPEEFEWAFDRLVRDLRAQNA